jgi:hypothetical protein
LTANEVIDMFNNSYIPCYSWDEDWRALELFFFGLKTWIFIHIYKKVFFSKK